MATTIYPLMTVIDDAGTITTGATVTIVSVTDKSGTAISSPGATVNQAGANVSVDYDATAKGEAWIVLAISKAGSTFSGLNAAPAFYLAVPASGGGGSDPWLTTLPGSYTPNQAGYILGTNLNATVSSRSTYAGGAVASVTAPVTVGTNNDKIGYGVASIATDALAAASVSAAAVTKIQTGLATTISTPANFAAMQITSDGKVATDGSRVLAIRNQDAVTAPTVDDAMVGAWVTAFGKEPTFTSTLWVKQKPDNSGAIRTHGLTTDAGGNVIART